jgi:transposase InsO family protein
MKRYEFVEQWKATFPIRRLCQALGVSPSGYWAWRRRAPSRRAVATAQLQRQIVSIYRVSRATYGAPRIHAELAAQGVRCSRKRVARLMRVAGIAGCHRRRFRTTRRVRRARRYVLPCVAFPLRGFPAQRLCATDRVAGAPPGPRAAVVGTGEAAPLRSARRHERGHRGCARVRAGARAPGSAARRVPAALCASLCSALAPATRWMAPSTDALCSNDAWMRTRWEGCARPARAGRQAGILARGSR